MKQKFENVDAVRTFGLEKFGMGDCTTLSLKEIFPNVNYPNEILPNAIFPNVIFPNAFSLTAISLKVIFPENKSTQLEAVKERDHQSDLPVNRTRLAL